MSRLWTLVTTLVSFTVAVALPVAAQGSGKSENSDCSVRPARGLDQADLRRLAKITSKDAEARAVLSVEPNKVNAVMSSDVEVVNGCLAYPLDLRFANKGGVQEVIVDAGNGKILSSSYEPPSGDAPAPSSGSSSAPSPSTPSATSSSGPTSAAPPPAALPLSESAAAAEEALVRKVVDAEEDAWNRGDAKAFAVRFQPEGSLTDVFGFIARGRAEIERRLADLFTLYFKGSLVALKVRRVRFPGSNVALVEVDTELAGFHKAPPGVYVDPEKVIRTRLLEVLTKIAGEWTIASYSSVEVKTPPASLVNPEAPANNRGRGRR